jgi:hypothetical protein
MLKQKWFVVRNNYIVKSFENLERAESFLKEKGWSEDRDDVSIIRYDR